ncbi:MAG: DinB family protein [Dehalococcoidia bacterium]
MTPLPLAVRFLLDAQDAFLQAADHIPAPGRGGPLGRLNSAGWVIAHLASSHDLWTNVLVAGRDRDPWAARWHEAQTAATLARPLPTPFDEARDACRAIAGRAAEAVQSLDGAALQREVATPRGTVAAGYLVARAAGHLLAHAGELAVIGALVTAPPLDLPGSLPRLDEVPAESAEADDPDRPPLVVRLLLDAQSEVRRVVDAMPAPAASGAIARILPGAVTIAEVANHEHRTWCVAAHGLAPDAWPGAAILRGSGDGNLPPFEEASAAYARAIEGSAPYLEALRAADLPRQLGGSTVGAAVVRSTALLFARAGELNALASLFEAPDLALPGMLARTAGGAR